jgi:hypothetical protein
MKRWLATFAIAAICTVPLRADVTITQTVSAEGGAAAMAGANMQSRIVMRIKDRKARTDMDIAGVSMTSLVDLTTKELYVLRADAKTATLMSPGSAASAQTRFPIVGDVSFKPTGQSRTIQNVQCDEYAIAMTLNMADMAGGQMPPDAAAMLQDVRMVMHGSMWIAKVGPGTADYISFQKAAAADGMAGMFGGAMGGSPQMGKMMAALAEAPGIPYLTEINMTVEGTGQVVEMMRGMGAMKMTTAVSTVSTDPIADDMFNIPADYKVVK